MRTQDAESGPGALVERLRQATNNHDLESLTRCFALDYRNETPAHP
ncbi:MAG: nuclear transport factor 2 family protein, partial [Chloroflexi bacterium]